MALLDPTAERLSRLPIRATAIYAALALVWIATSDHAVAALGLSPAAYTVKGWAFVVVTSLALYTTLRAMVVQIRRSQPAEDSLTRLPNRALFTERLTETITRARPDRQSIAVITLGLDRFRVLNDTLGQGSGDEALVRTVERLERVLRATDVLGRIGGDEFGILQPNVRRPDDVPALAQRVLGAVSAPFTIRGTEVRLTTSIGIALFPSDGATAEDLLKSSDLALLRAKREGRDTYRFFVPAMNDAARERADIETGLHRALEAEEFLLHYQPQFELATGRVVGVEALIRWNRPGEGLVSPARFLPIAEELGLIRPIGAWVLRTATLRARSWSRSNVAFGRISVNISFGQFRQRDLDQSIRDQLTASELPAELLELELTESILAEEVERAIELVARLHQLGVGIAIDDFGTGYSSLSYLRQFKVDQLKIDKSFVAGIGRDSSSEAIIRAIVGLARSLGQRTLAEGVETAEQAAFLRESGCDSAQGYHFARPLDEKGLLEFLRTRPLPPG